ncbi:hypothetical protein [Longibaculum muris]|uniref:hypothetical protein n=1 Tax=Longibaculum muris TaxID=1796628 RepID=UPI002941BD21|nr:hypothetical protein [Longibaculum muris]
MKKSTILSLATAIAVVGTSAFTFAAWDQLDATQNATLTYRKPVKLTETITQPTEGQYELGTEAPATTVEVSFEIENTDSKATKLELTPTLNDSAGTNLDSKVNIAIQDMEGNAISDNTDTVTGSETKNYKVVITPTAASYEDMNNAELTVAGKLQ